MSDSRPFPDVHRHRQPQPRPRSRSSSAASPRPRAGCWRPSPPATACTSASTTSCRSPSSAPSCPDGVTVSYDQGDGLYRVDGACGSAAVLADWIRAWAARHGSATIGLRAETDVRRRAPRDLPADFLNDLCRHYGPVSLKRLQRNMSTIRLHLPDPDDLGQQVYEWVLKAVSQYDETKGVPFGAFLATQLSKWVHDLGRNAHGRTAADTEHKQQKAIAAFIAEHQRRPSEKELAAYMGQSVATLRRNSQTVATLNGLRNLQSLDGGPDATEILLPDSSEAPDEIMGEAEQTLLSHALTAACAPDPTARPRPARRPAERARLGDLVPDHLGRPDQDPALGRPQHLGAEHERLRRPRRAGAEDAAGRARRLSLLMSIRSPDRAGSSLAIDPRAGRPERRARTAVVHRPAVPSQASGGGAETPLMHPQPCAIAAPVCVFTSREALGSATGSRTSVPSSGSPVGPPA